MWWLPSVVNVANVPGVHRALDDALIRERALDDECPDRRRAIVIGIVLAAAVTGALLAVPAPYWVEDRYTAWSTAVQAFGTVMAFAATTAALLWVERDAVNQICARH